MSNSSLVSYTKLSPNHSGKRTHSIDRITAHCVVGQLSCESICDCFPASRDASCNYGIGTDGRISLCVEEKTVLVVVQAGGMTKGQLLLNVLLTKLPLALSTMQYILP